MESSSDDHLPSDSTETTQNEYKINADFEDFIFNSSIVNLENIDEIDKILTMHDFDLPKSLIITNMDIRIFSNNSDQKEEFENAFRMLDPDAKFLYFKSFRRARIDFQLNNAATKARIVCNQLRIGDETINCYFAEVTDTSNPDNSHLKPPALEKQFLISPPASPPEGWEPVEEAQPVLNIDLQNRLANLIPGSTHELHQATESQPGIVVHICDESGNTKPTESEADVLMMKSKIKIVHTPCPPKMQQTARP